jgi:diacylglycerol O-acyltransferase / wax synthase
VADNGFVGGEGTSEGAGNGGHMAYSHYERLTALDATFLEVEDANAHMHVGAVSLFDAAPLIAADGTIDMDRIRRMVEVSLHRVPRYQQRLAWIPVFGYPVWIDDARFNLNYHLRHVSLPKPGDERLLKRLTGRIMSQQLDRGKPLWELWIVDGVEGNRVAMITKAHHCMIDGVGSAELSGSLIRASAELERRLDDPPRWIPRPAPTPSELLLGEMARRAAEPFGVLRAAREALADPRGALRAVGDAVLGIGEALAAGMQPASPTPLNIDIGPHRRFDWLDMQLDAIRDVRTRLGGTVNDVVLATVSGALGRFLRGRGLRVEDLDFRAMIPVNIRTEEKRESLGNQIAMMVAHLPLAERDPRRRLQRVIESTRELKRSRQALGVKTLEEVSDWTLTTLFSAFARLSTATRPYNIVVTNVPGPQFPTYFLGAEMRSVYPLVPLNRNQALGIALFSYNGGLYWGFNSDWDAVPDLHELVDAVGHEFEQLRQAALAAPANLANDGKPPPSRRARRPRDAQHATA